MTSKSNVCRAQKSPSSTRTKPKKHLIFIKAFTPPHHSCESDDFLIEWSYSETKHTTEITRKFGSFSYQLQFGKTVLSFDMTCCKPD